MKILIIDNDQTMRAVLRRILSVAGIDVLECDELGAATHIIQSEVLDVVIADLNFLETAEEDILARWTTLGKFKLVGMYAPGDEELVAALKKKNFRYFFRKPFKVPEIAAVLSQISGKVIDLEKKILPVETKTAISPGSIPVGEKKTVARTKKKIPVILPGMILIAAAVAAGYYLWLKPVTVTWNLLNNDPAGLVVVNEKIFVLDALEQKIYQYNRKNRRREAVYNLPRPPSNFFWIDEKYVYLYNDWENKLHQGQITDGRIVLSKSYPVAARYVTGFCLARDGLALITLTGEFYLLNHRGQIIGRQKFPDKKFFGLASWKDGWLVLAEDKIYQMKKNFLIQRVYELPPEVRPTSSVSAFFASGKKLYFTFQGQSRVLEIPIFLLKKSPEF